jgi:hypothetical protein
MLLKGCSHQAREEYVSDSNGGGLGFGSEIGW